MSLKEKLKKKIFRNRELETVYMLVYVHGSTFVRR